MQQAGLQAASRILMKCVPSFLFQCCFQGKTAATSSNASSNSDAASENVNESVFKFIFPSDATKIESDSAPQDSDGTFKSTTKSRFQVFTYKQLKNATNGFTLRLGRGGFGSVYYGKLEDGREVAIKSFHENKDKTIQQFLNEIKMLSSLRHPNLLSSYGCSCSHSHKLLLVYEYISNGTLSDHLYGKLAKASTVAWPVRLNIAIETASALAYLHASGIIHRDVKSGNILLDDNFSAKVADFGLSRGLPLVSCAKYATHASTAPQGTHGYMDPEYFRSHRVSDKSDVYSFGVVLCELMLSKPAAPIEMNGEYHSFAAHAASMIQDEGLEHLVDPSLGFGSDNEIRQSITVVGELAFQCLQCPKELRPSMKQVLQTLQGIKQGTWRFHQIT